MGLVTTDWAAMDMTGNLGGYIDFTVPNVDFNGRFSYTHSAQQFQWYVNNTSGWKMHLNSIGLGVGGTLVSTSDKILKFNAKPLINALDVIHRLEPVEYDQTYDLVDHYTTDTPQAHQCGFIAQSVQTIAELKHAVVGGEVGEDGA